MEHHADRGPELVENGVAVVHQPLDEASVTASVLLRFKKPIPLHDKNQTPTRMVWFLLTPEATHPHLDSAIEFAHLAGNQGFFQAVLEAEDAREIREAYDRALDQHVHFGDELPSELRPTGRLFGALVADLQRKLPYYLDDFRAGLNTKCVASILFLFFACLAPAIAFGGLLSVMTEGTLGAVEMITGTAVVGMVYALLAAQPLTILGSTGPIIIFLGLLYPLCQRLEIPYLPTMACVGLWTALILLVLVALDGCSWIRYFTRFTDETFAALISVIFIYEAVKDVVNAFKNPEVGYASALLTLVLALGTFYVAMTLSRFRQSPYLRRMVREFLADFGPAIAIVIMVGVSFFFREVSVEMLGVPETFATTSGRPWFVNPLEAPAWVWGASIVPALLLAILVYLDQNITVRLVNNPDYRLQKGAGYHLDLTVASLAIAACSLVGIPWMVAATVRSLNHVRSLANVETDAQGRERVVSVVENRVTGFGVHLLIGVSLAFLPLLRNIPMPVLFGLFLFMGVASMAGNQLFERVRLWFMEPSRYPATYYLRVVPTKVVHLYTAIQGGCLAVLWVVKSSALGIIFPLFIALLVPVRMSLDRFFNLEHLALLDAEEMPEEEERREAGP